MCESIYICSIQRTITKNMLRLNVSYSIENIKYNNAPPAHHKSISNNTQRDTHSTVCNDSTVCLLLLLLLLASNIFSFSYLFAYSSLLLPTLLLLPSSSSPLLLPLLLSYDDSIRRLWCMYASIHTCFSTHTIASLSRSILWNMKLAW